MSEAKTLHERLMIGRANLTRAKLEADDVEGEALVMSERYRRATEHPEFQELMLHLWYRLRDARKLSCLSMEEFVHALFSTEIVVGEGPNVKPEMHVQHCMVDKCVYGTPQVCADAKAKTDLVRCAENCVPDVCKYERGEECAMRHDPKMERKTGPNGDVCFVSGFEKGTCFRQHGHDGEHVYS